MMPAGLWQELWRDRHTRRMRSGWRALTWLVIATAASVLVAGALIALITLLGGPDAWSRLPWYGRAGLESCALVIGTWCASIWTVNQLDELPADTLGVELSWTALKQIGLGALIGAGVVGGLVLGALGVGLVEWQRQAVTPLDLGRGTGAVPWLLVAAIAFLLPRLGYGFQTLLRGVGPLWALLVILLYSVGSLWRQDPSLSLLSLTNDGLITCACALWYLRERSLWPGVGFLLGWNAAQVVLGLPITPFPLPFLAPFKTTLHGPAPYFGTSGIFEDNILVSAALLLLITWLTYTGREPLLADPWWEWPEYTPDWPATTCWDFQIDDQYYQFKLLPPEEE
jgi:hypothetical protein